MISDSIGSRAELLSLQRGISAEGGELVVPVLRRHKPDLTPSTITHTKWLDTLRKCIQLGVDGGIFENHTVDEIVSLAFKGAREGWCLGTAKCLSADRNVRTPIARTVETIFANPERPCMVQICSDLRYSLKCSADSEDREWSFRRIDKACQDSGYRKKFDKGFTKVLHRSKAFYRENKIKNLDDEQFLTKKYQLVSDMYKEECRSKKDRIGSFITVTSERQEKIAQECLKRIMMLEEEILGAPLPTPTRILRKNCQCHKARPSKRKQPPEFREIQLYYKDHVQSAFIQRGEYYLFELGAGLIRIPYEKETPSKGGEDSLPEGVYKIKVFKR